MRENNSWIGKKESYFLYAVMFLREYVLNVRILSTYLFELYKKYRRILQNVLPFSLILLSKSLSCSPLWFSKDKFISIHIRKITATFRFFKGDRKFNIIQKYVRLLKRNNIMLKVHSHFNHNRENILYASLTFLFYVLCNLCLKKLSLNMCFHIMTCYYPKPRSTFKHGIRIELAGVMREIYILRTHLSRSKLSYPLKYISTESFCNESVF